MPSPRADSATHIRLISAGWRAGSFSPPHPTGSPHKVATRNNPAGRAEELWPGRTRRRLVEPFLEASIDLGEVRVEAALRVAMCGIDDVDADERRGEQPLDLGHGVHEALLFGRAQRLEHRADERVAPLVEHDPLGDALPGEPGDAYASVVCARLDGDETVGLERPQEPSGVAGVEVEVTPQLADVAALGADLPQHPGLAERTVAREVVVVERADALGHQAVEAAHSVDDVAVDSLTLVRES